MTPSPHPFRKSSLTQPISGIDVHLAWLHGLPTPRTLAHAKSLPICLMNRLPRLRPLGNLAGVTAVPPSSSTNVPQVIHAFQGLPTIWPLGLLSSSSGCSHFFGSKTQCNISSLKMVILKLAGISTSHSHSALRELLVP